ncbi:MAG: hypothetical protein AABN95_23675 [Acidobacteriota bacterium]
MNKRARTGATALGLTILLTVLWIYLPMLLAAPTDLVALNFFFATLLFCGAILLLANSIARNQLWRGFSAATPSRRADREALPWRRAR